MCNKYLNLFLGLIILTFSTLAYADNDYETPFVVQAKDVVPKDLLESDLYSIEDEVITRGYTNTYQIKSKFGDFTVHGNAMLARRIQEIKAIDELAKVKIKYV